MLYALLFSWSAAAADRAPEVGITVEPLVAVDIDRDNESADTLESWTWIRARAKQRTDDGQWFLGVDGEHNVRHGLDTEAIWSLRVAESGWAGMAGPVHVRAGALIERWGKLDLTPVVDVLNPKDLRAGPLATVEALRIPVPMVTTEVGNNNIRAQAVWVPFPGTDRVTTEGSNWSLIKPGMVSQLAQEASSWDGASAALLSQPIEQLAESFDQASPSTMRALTEALGGVDQPEADGTHGTYGLRLAFEAPRVDASFLMANLQSSIPATQVSPSIRRILAQETLPALDEFATLLDRPLIETTWPRTWLSGAELSTTVGPFGVRSEVGWWSNKVVQTPWFNSSQSPAIAAGLGLDWSQGSLLYLAAEGRWNRWLKPPDQIFLDTSERFEVGGTARLTLANDTVQVQAAGLVDLSHQEWMVRPEIRWRVSDPFSCGVGAVLIDAPNEAPRTIQDTLTWTGGPLGLMAENDSIFFSLRWMK